MKLSTSDLRKIIDAKGSKSAIEVAKKFECSVGRVYELWRGNSDPHFSKKLISDTKRVFKFASSSSDRIYQTILNVDGTTSCNCRGWIFKRPNKVRSCTHTLQITR